MSWSGSAPWTSSAARRSLVGSERTGNPIPAAYALLGRRRVKGARRFFAKLKRKRAHRGNPLPAAVATITGLLGGKLGRRLKGKEAAHAERMAQLAQLAERALANDASALEQLERLTREFATQRAKDAAKATLAAVRNELATRREVRGREARAATRAEERERQAVTTQRLGILSGAAEKIGGALVRGGRPRAAGGVRRVAAGVARRAGSVAGAGAGAAGAAGASAAAVAGVVIGGLAAGALIGTGLRLAFGEARAVRAEEAAVEGALVLRRTRAQLEQQLGRRLTSAESRKLSAAYLAQLEELGFRQDTQGRWHRPRSAIERFLG